MTTLFIPTATDYADPFGDDEPELWSVPDMPAHEVANLFRMMDATEYEGLLRDIQANGLREPIWTLDGTILDGRNRYKACQELNIRPATREYTGPTDIASLVAFVMSLNLQRRHLSSSQRSMLALDVEKLLAAELERQRREKISHYRQTGETVEIFPPSPKAREQAAAITGTNGRYVSDAKKVATQAPELVNLVRDGTLTIPDATELIKYDEGTRATLLTMATTGEAKNVKDAARKQKQHEREQALAQQRQQAELQAQFVNTDAVSFLARFAPRSVDMLLTDPPYSTDVDDFEGFLDTWLYDALDKVKDTGRAFICAGPYPEEVNTYLTRLLAYPRLLFGNMLVWTYRNTIGPTPSHTFKNNWQAIFYLYGKDAPPLDSPSMLEQFSVIDIAAPDGRQGNRYHAWQKPDELGERLIRIASQPNDFIIDPFCCTGTFGLAAAKLGRRSLSGDRDADAIATCVQRGGVQVD